MTIKLSVSLTSDSALYLAGPFPNLNFEIRNKPEFIRSKLFISEYFTFSQIEYRSITP